ncbi:3-hydroxyacyl-CoA dehydrogenase NAD-binding domain-containing protein [Rhodococcus sp. FXJ9.536]|uniref:3-hydroxyacyl-CoA dehydrogenase NAD-binding domain-containing protein n=2 Tax=Rhodococcus tibetensis TaxID=2965064 RepID=A0ABT1QJN4_9NOCA|nr:3-hydroxyacyl-CoA dehydrogenase NAD-binding domain-containing protein [Rhodococcus sp. FXJ9.536]MCQ4122372.1 3-hydroxyacyl-CoA dehydrogenase NAD-binding domain-containing protein [Rhodococcus sp. FXJ9.536]
MARASGERFPLGYCAAGEVVEVGPRSPGFSVGDRVIAMGWGRAVHGTLVWVPHRLCVRIPDHLDPAEAVVANLTATAVHALDRSGAMEGEHALVVGAGIVGLLVAQVAASRGLDVTVVDNDSARTEAVDAMDRSAITAADWNKLAAHPTGGTRRHVFMCISGDGTAALHEATDWAVRGGPRPVITAVGRFVASTKFSVDHGNIDYRVSARCGEGYRDNDYELGHKQIRVPSREGTVTENLHWALRLVEDGLVSLSGMQIYEGHFDRATEAYAALHRSTAWTSARLAYGGDDD